MQALAESPFYEMTILSKGPEETEQIGRDLGRRLKAGDVVCLYGQLGAGKTTMIKGIAEAIGIQARDITSASFIIIAEHKGICPLYHIDLYRLSEADVPDIGLEEYLWGDGICVIEWAERAEKYLPEKRIEVTISIRANNEREITIK